jgi:undecaprenyl-diphosphatase
MALVRVRDAAGAIFVTVAVSGLMAAVLKNVIGRARPNVGEGAYSVRSFAFDSSLAAFPSGHAATGAAIAVVFGLLMPRYRWALMWIGALVCASRVLLGAHWVSDVVAGWTVGMAVTLALSAAAARRGFAFRFDRRGRLVPRGHVRFVVAGLGRLPVGVWAVQAQAWVANRVERWRGAWDQRTRAPWLRVRQVITRRRFG